MPGGPIPGGRGESRCGSSRCFPGRRRCRSGPACGNGRKKRDGKSAESLSFCRNLVVDKVRDSGDNESAGLIESQWSPSGGRNLSGLHYFLYPSSGTFSSHTRSRTAPKTPGRIRSGVCGVGFQIPRGGVKTRLPALSRASWSALTLGSGEGLEGGRSDSRRNPIW